MSVLAISTGTTVVIYAVRIHETQHHTADGVTVFTHIPPLRLFFVDLHDGEDEIGVWDGADYVEALAAAREWAKDGATIRDLTSETWGSA